MENNSAETSSSCGALLSNGDEITEFNRIVSILRQTEPYDLSEGKNSISVEMNKVLQDLLRLLQSNTIRKDLIRTLCKNVFSHLDLYLMVLRKIIPSIKEFVSRNSHWNLYNLLRYYRLPNRRLEKPFYKDNMVVMKKIKKKFIDFYQQAWIEFLKLDLERTLIKKILSYLCEKVLPVIKDGQLMGDFLFRCYKLGGIYAILSLEGIYTLITEHNFEYEGFYDSLYRLITPSICYVCYREKFFTLLDTCLTSTHLPAYIVGSFIKRITRILLFSPLTSVLPLISLVRNLLVRYKDDKNIMALFMSEDSEALSSDPFNMEATSLIETNALSSSLWEFKALQNHWFSDARKRADFISKSIPQMESFIKWRPEEDYFKMIMRKRFGEDLKRNMEEETYLKNQDGCSDDSDLDNKNKNNRKRRKLENKKVNYADITRVAVNIQEPNDEFIMNSAYWNS